MLLQILLVLLHINLLQAEKIDLADREDWPLTDFSQQAIPLSEFVDSGLGKDGFRSLDQPVFETNDQAQRWLPDTDPVIAVSIADHVKAYPLRILLYHELVNDELAGQPIAITYCPLCNAAMVFSRAHDNQVLEFGISGKVYSSNMIMYDRQTESWWLQFTGKGVVGTYNNHQLDLLPSQIVSFAHFRQAFPNGKILSNKTGYNKKYGLNPYLNYDSRQQPFGKFFPRPTSDRLPPLARVLGVSINGKSVVYPLSALGNRRLLQHEPGNTPLVIIASDRVASAVDARQISQSKKTLAAAAYSRVVDDQRLDFLYQDERIIDAQTKSEWNLFGRAINGPYKGKQLAKMDRGVYFAFVWLDFYPQSLIYRYSDNSVNCDKSREKL